MQRLFFSVALTAAVLTGIPPALAQSTARQAGYLYLSPVPGAPYVSAQTCYILLRFTQVTPAEVTNLLTDFIAVTGAQTGPHPGTARVASDGRTVMFVMSTAFSVGELVTVSLNPILNSATGGVQAFQYEFSVGAPMPGSLPPVAEFVHTPSGRLLREPPDERTAFSWPMQFRTNYPGTGPLSGRGREAPKVNRGQVAQTLRMPTAKRTRQGAVPQAIVMPNGVSVPSDFPQVVITVNSNPSPGYLFLENGLNEVPPYTMILDNSGLPVWYHRGRMYDFKIQKNRMITWCLSDDTGFAAFDLNFNYLKTYLTTNGYLTDGHELKIMADGSYYMIGYQLNKVDLSKYLPGGNSDSTVRETAVQGFTLAGDLIFQWRAWDNYDIRDPPMYNTDFPHINGLDIDEDGNILVSARHLSEVTKVNRDTGDIIWRLSGVHSSFTFVNDPFNGTSFQHNISALGNGHYMVFDNGDLRTPQVSRAAEFQLDLKDMTATLAWEFRDTPDKYAYYLGSAQRLPSGNTLIDFVMAQYPKAIEVDTNGVKHFELSLVPGSDSYRAFRLPWQGKLAAPYLVVEPQVDNVTLLFNQFGATNVAYYRVYGGTSPEPTTLMGQTSNTLQRLSNLQNGVYYFRVTSVSPVGVESPFSNEETVDVNIIPPGMNIVQNGDFSQGTNNWIFALRDTAIATWDVQAEASQFTISSGGESPASIQLFQPGIALIQSDQYVLEFDAWSDQARYLEVQLAQNFPPFGVYTQMAPSFLTPNNTHYRYIFTMKEPSDFSVNLLFNLGASTAAVFLENIVLFNPPVGDFNLDGRVDFLDLGAFVGSWLKQQAGLPADLNHDGKVDFNDFSIFGENWTPSNPSQ
jgi:hypothetical protein